MISSEYLRLDEKIEILWKTVLGVGAWLTLVAVAIACVFALATPAYGQAIGDVSGEPSIHLRSYSVTCFTDPHFFDNWQTTTSLSWDVSEFPKAWVNDHDFEIWSDGYRRATVPLGAERFEGLDEIQVHSRKTSRAPWSFKVVKRTTTEKVMFPEIEAAAVASCSFRPPEDGSAWVWEETAFVLRPVVTTGPPHDPDKRWEVTRE